MFDNKWMYLSFIVSRVCTPGSLSSRHTIHVLTGTPLPAIIAIYWKTAKLMETKKDVGVMSLSAPIPSFRPSHCPQIRISNVKPAHVERNIYIPETGAFYICKDSIPITSIHLIILKQHVQGRYKSTHVDASVASPLYLDSNLRDLSEQTGNV